MIQTRCVLSVAYTIKLLDADAMWRSRCNTRLEINMPENINVVISLPGGNARLEIKMLENINFMISLPGGNARLEINMPEYINVVISLSGCDILNSTNPFVTLQIYAVTQF